MNIDGREWKLVPVDPPESAIDDACREHKSGVMCLARQNFVRNWRKTLAAAPAPPVVSVTDEMAHRVANSFYGEATLGNKLEVTEVLQLWQRELGPALGMVAREEMARMVEAAYRECASELCHYDTALVDQWWAESDARKRLEGGR